jgi:hypothetical protein
LYIDEGQTTQRPKEKGQTMMYKTPHRKLNIEVARTPPKPDMSSYAPEKGDIFLNILTLLGFDLISELLLNFLQIVQAKCNGYISIGAVY